MKQESVLSVLMFLFRHHMEENCSLSTSTAELVDELTSAGFSEHLVYAALDWLAKLEDQTDQPITEPHPDAVRVFSEMECEYLDLESRRLILNLEHQGILNPRTREIVIHQLVGLAEEEIDLSLVKWVTLMVLFNQPEEGNALQAMEFLVLDGSAGGTH